MGYKMVHSAPELCYIYLMANCIFWGYLSVVFDSLCCVQMFSSGSTLNTWAVDSHQLGHGQRSVRVSSSLQKKQDVTALTDAAVGYTRFLSHHLEDNSVLLSLTGPEHHSIVWSHKIHRLQHLWQNTQVWGVSGCVLLNHQLSACTGDSYRSPPADTEPFWCRSAPETSSTKITTLYLISCQVWRLHPHLTVNHISSIVQSQQPHGQSPDPDHRGQGGDVPEAQLACYHHGTSVVLLWAQRRQESFGQLCLVFRIRTSARNSGHKTPNLQPWM